MTNPDNDPHRDQPVLTAGAALAGARAAVILVHGRGAGAADILGLSEVIERPELAYLAPEAARRVWYPNSFMVPVADNEPWLTSALAVIDRLVAEVGAAGIPPERVAILGFSQGACLSVEYAARHPRRYGAVLALSGGLIGAQVSADGYTGSLAGTPVFFGCSDVDPFIPLDRVLESVAIMKERGATVTERIYPGAGHTIVPDEIENVRRLLDAIPGGS
jgi:predicted esterase